MSRLDAHIRNCASDDCDFCGTVYDLRTHPDDRDPYGWLADVAEARESRWRDAS